MDNCLITENPDPANSDRDDVGDACDDGSDGLVDADDVNLYGTDPLISNTDGDGCDDGYDVDRAFGSPFTPTSARRPYRRAPGAVGWLQSATMTARSRAESQIGRRLSSLVIR